MAPAIGDVLDVNGLALEDSAAEVVGKPVAAVGPSGVGLEVAQSRGDPVIEAGLAWGWHGGTCHF